MKPQVVREKRDEFFAYGSVLEAVSQGLYPNRKHIVREFVQNAYDALSDLHRLRPAISLAAIEIKATAPSLIIADKGIGMSEESMQRYRYLGFSEKQIGTHAGFRGIGKYSAISVCDRLIVSSSRLGDKKSYQVVIDAAAMWKRLQEEKNPPLDALLKDHSEISETKEDAGQHYTLVELRGIRKDASELLSANALKRYLVQVAPLPFDPSFSYGKEIAEHLGQTNPHFLQVNVLVNGKPVYKPFLTNCSRPDYMEILSEGESGELIAYTWFCQHLGKGQFRLRASGNKQGLRHPSSGLQYRLSNFAVGDNMLPRKTLWQTTPERAFYFLGEIHVLDSGVIPTSARDDFEDTTARGRLYKRCQKIAAVLSLRAGQESQQQRFGEVVLKGQTLVSDTEAELKSGKLESELREDKDFAIQKLLEDLGKRLKQSSSSRRKDEKALRRAKQVIRRAENLRRKLRARVDGKDLFVDISKLLKMDRKMKALYSTIISVLREEFRQEPGRFAAVVRRIHEALRKADAC
jgi:hypothetical protein